MIIEVENKVIDSLNRTYLIEYYILFIASLNAMEEDQDQAMWKGAGYTMWQNTKWRISRQDDGRIQNDV